MELRKIQGSITLESDVNGYNVIASVQYDANGKVTHVQGGMIRKENRTLANFNIFYQPNGETTESHNFYSLTDDEEQAVAGIINDFVAKAISKVNL